MLSVTDSGKRRGFSFEKRGKAYRYLEDWMVTLESQAPVDEDYSSVNVTLDAVLEGEGIVDSIDPGKGIRKIGFGVIVKMIGSKTGGRKFKIGKGGLTNDMLSGVDEGNYKNLPKVGQAVKYKYCSLNPETNLPKYPALTDDYIIKRNIGSMHVGSGKKNWKKLGMKRMAAGVGKKW